ncbi:ribonucleotide reductase large subunit [Phascolarctid gammaherpesvirus 1]|uniref:Ribonucleoside-diphosphate reductase n=1 Tax=Phascolarctid gammaherpesvirus 1 TaxID=2249313 RepID=A0A3S8D7K1_9GAMA|nr:ribonucleotide reductase large subunit [Phascolarctid gammaherpesvirus 1]AZB49233.1 ribonucleotide reductase large subunit [Phascolarctid gammaherpesvirus 1]
MADQSSLVAALVDSLKCTGSWDLDGYILSGQLQHYLQEKTSTQTIVQYLNSFSTRLSEPVLEFITRYTNQLQAFCDLFKNSGDYRELVSRGRLSAVRFRDTYVLEGPGGIHESVPHFFMRIAVFCTVTARDKEDGCLYRTIRDFASRHGITISHDLDLFMFFFKPLCTQLVSCSTPIMRAAGLIEGNLASCFIVDKPMSTTKETVAALCEEVVPLLSTESGLGINCTNFQSSKSITSLLKILNSHVGYFNESSRRPASVATYIEPWHKQIYDFLNAKNPENPDRCGHIFQGICIPSLFFEKYLADPNSLWYLFDPQVASRLPSLYGEAFEAEYERLVAEGLYTRAVPLKSLMFSIVSTILKTGSPYIINKDSCNRRYWRETQNEAINAANLCAEVIQKPTHGVATCNLANITLPKCLREVRPYAARGTVCTDPSDPWSMDVSAWTTLEFSMPTLEFAVGVAVMVINCAILGGNSITEAMAQSQRERSMGLGLHGLADVQAMLGHEYVSEESRALCAKIYQKLYITALKISHDIVNIGKGTPFSGWEDSHLYKSGIFHFSQWSQDPVDLTVDISRDMMQSICSHGLFNSQLVALMPTAGTSQLTGFSDSFYPFYSNISTKITGKEEIIHPNMTFLKQVVYTDMAAIQRCGGEISKLPPKLQVRYGHFKSAFEYDQHALLSMASLYAPFVDQSASHSFFITEDAAKRASSVVSLLLDAYRRDLKTLMYYCRIKRENLCNFLRFHVEDEVSAQNNRATDVEAQLPQTGDHDRTTDTRGLDGMACESYQRIKGDPDNQDPHIACLSCQ